MNIGKYITWRESVYENKKSEYVKVGERDVTGIIIDSSQLRTGAKTIKIDIIYVHGYGPGIIGTQIWRKRAKVTHGLSWYRATMKPRKPRRRH